MEVALVVALVCTGVTAFGLSRLYDKVERQILELCKARESARMEDNRRLDRMRSDINAIAQALGYHRLLVDGPLDCNGVGLGYSDPVTTGRQYRLKQKLADTNADFSALLLLHLGLEFRDEPSKLGERKLVKKGK